MIATICVIIALMAPKETTEKNGILNFSETNKNKEQEETEENDEIRSLSESNRMKRYIGIFFDNIEEGKYQEAYNVLNQDFKDVYFPTLEEFTTYANQNFNSSMLGVKYDNIERWGNKKTGNMYVLWLTIANATKMKKEGEEKPQTTFIIIEKDYNNYEMSFSKNI